MPIEKYTNLNVISTSFLVVGAGSTKILSGVTNRSVEVLAYWVNGISTNTVCFTADGFNPDTGGALSGSLFIADRGGSVNAGPTGAYDSNGRLIPWFRTGTNTELYINLLNGVSASGLILYQIGT